LKALPINGCERTLLWTKPHNKLLVRTPFASLQKRARNEQA